MFQAQKTKMKLIEQNKSYLLFKWWKQKKKRF